MQLIINFFLPASKIDLYVGELPSDTHTSLEAAHFKRLGYVSLSDNEQTGYRVSGGWMLVLPRLCTVHIAGSLGD